jgi:hypothetical protein
MLSDTINLWQISDVQTHTTVSVWEMTDKHVLDDASDIGCPLARIATPDNNVRF